MDSEHEARRLRMPLDALFFPNIGPDEQTISLRPSIEIWLAKPCAISARERELGTAVPRLRAK